MEDTFSIGYRYVADNLSGATGAAISQAWIDNANKNISEASKKIAKEMIASAQKKNSGVDQLQGYMAEIWHTETLNADAKIHNAKAIAKQPDVNTFGSADVVVGKKNFSLKSYNTDKGSTHAMSETPWERYSK